jgi:hypothetical protein
MADESKGYGGLTEAGGTFRVGAQSLPAQPTGWPHNDSVLVMGVKIPDKDQRLDGSGKLDTGEDAAED